jgi:type IV pilus assembly protein PilB
MLDPNISQKNVINVIDDIFADAVKEGASDIHFEPQRDKLIIRYRVDGSLNIVFRGALSLYEKMLARVKVLAQLDMTGLPKPQEGNIRFEDEDAGAVDLRISIFPVNFGECIVIRILEDKLNVENFANLGFSNEQINELEKVIRKPYGLILVTGPTGSGKSTTIFSMLSKLNTPDKSIVTLEDPVERKIKMIRQTRIDASRGLTFAEGLKRLMRQDPDVIMVGEIRDRETAKIAVQAAVTGSLVLATIHTNTAAGAIVRLINMGVEPFLLASSLKFISAQRLGRQNCPDCKEEYVPSKQLTDILDAPIGAKFYHSTGCSSCSQRGFKGRKAIHEVLMVSREIEDLILTKPSDDQIQTIAVREGMVTLRRAALEKVYEGKICIEEAIRLTE